MKFFNGEALFKYPSLLTGESTPSYLLHSDIVIPRFLALAPTCKVLVTLRNPVDRAYSQFQVCNVRKYIFLYAIIFFYVAVVLCSNWFCM
jgi:hypothetical protein